MMEAKEWRTLRLTINGLGHKVRYNQATIDGLFLPFLRRLTKGQKEQGRRMLVYLAAPPGTGKSTLALLLEKLSLTDPALTPVQALGLDGFHYPESYLRSHNIMRHGRSVSLHSIKGAPETFQVDALLEKLARIHEEEIRWPFYDRTIHDVIENVIPVRRPIILLEGNWLLLGEGRWQAVRSQADYSLFIQAEPSYLKERLIARKMAGGKSREEAEAFYAASDLPNVERVLRRSWPADETWQLMPDGDYQRKSRIVPTRLVNREALWQKPDVRIDNSLLSGLNRRMNAEQTGSALYRNGYAEGLSAARRTILRKLYQNGTMTSKAIMETFHLSEEELKNILDWE